MIKDAIEALLAYGIETGLLEVEDRQYTYNQFLELFKLDELEDNDKEKEYTGLEEILKDLLDYAVEKEMIEDTITHRDLFDTKIMSVLLPRPSEVIRKFNDLYKNKSPREATDYYYKFSQDTDYIRRYRVIKDQKWKVDTEYGEIDITINLSKPEKDPRAIAAAKNAKQSGYPKCLLCVENEGYAGRMNHPARQNHRIIPIKINGQPFGFQYSPYVYYNEHCIVFNQKHIPMVINEETFKKLLSFVEKFPHYMIGSNADLPVVGGSILSHDHYQGGNYTFAMAKAPVEKEVMIRGFEGVKAGIVKWPMSVIRLSSPDIHKIVSLSTHILTKWRNYSDESVHIRAFTDQEPHNTITPIARKIGKEYQMDLVLRNNRTTKEHPLGLFHPHGELHHIKKENIGLIEVMGLAVLPARLKTEMELLAQAILENKKIEEIEELEKHAKWVEEFLPTYDTVTKDNIMDILHQEIGAVFCKVLEDAGVYKRNQEGQEAFLRFINTLSE